MKRIAQIISVVFHPLLIPSYVFLILINTYAQYSVMLPQNYRYLMLLLVFLTSFVLPLLLIMVMLKLKIIESLEMRTKQERALPLLITAGFFYLTYHFLRQAPHFALFNFFMLGSALLAIISLLINYFHKISLHMTGLGGLFGAFTGFSLVLGYNYTILITVIVLLSGLVGFARLQLKTHTESEIYTGFVLGFVVMAGVFMVV